MPSDRRGKNDLYVVPTEQGWALKTHGAKRVTRVYSTRAEATKAAQEMLRTKGGEVRIQGRNGRWRESFTLGRDDLEKISEVEGIRLSRDMRGAFREMDRRELSAGQRREAIANRFGKKR